MQGSKPMVPLWNPPLHIESFRLTLLGAIKPLRRKMTLIIEKNQ